MFTPIRTTTTPDDIQMGDMVTFDLLGSTMERTVTDVHRDADGKTTEFEYELPGTVVARQFRWLPISAATSVRI
jgi:hypothetical protein